MESSHPPSATIYLLVLALLLFCSMFFSASETAFMSSSRLHIRYLKEKRNRSASRVERLLGKKSLFLNTILVGNNIVNIATSSIVTALAVNAFGDAGIGIATFFATLILLVFGEILPKSAALLQPERFALKTSLPLTILIVVMAPIVSVFTLITGIFTFLIGGRITSAGASVTEEDIKTMIEVGEEEGVIEPTARDMLHKILNYTDLNTRDIMTPRTDLTAIHIGATRREILEISHDSHLSRFPVYGDDIDDIRGILYIKDFLFAPDVPDGEFSVKDIIRPALFIFESRKISDVQKILHDENQNMAIVLDEYGGTAGLISTEDLIEEIFGGIRDEYDRADGAREGAESADEGIYSAGGVVIDGSERLDTLNLRFGTNLSSAFYDSIGGLIMERLGDIPAEGAQIREQGLTFTVIALTGNRIDAVRVESAGDLK